MRKTVAAIVASSGLAVLGCASSQKSLPSPVVEAAAVVSESKPDGSRGNSYGIVSFEDSPHGLVITPKLRGLDPGPHALHVHEHPDCSPDAAGMPAGAAGGHYDPAGTSVHAGPYADGHLGDLPNLMAEPNGMATLPVLAPRVTVADLKGRSLMIHAGPDRYDEYGEHMHGKGGPRMYCGLIR